MYAVFFLFGSCALVDTVIIPSGFFMSIVFTYRSRSNQT